MPLFIFTYGLKKRDRAFREPLSLPTGFKIGEPYSILHLQAEEDVNLYLLT